MRSLPSSLGNFFMASPVALRLSSCTPFLFIFCASERCLPLFDLEAAWGSESSGKARFWPLIGGILRLADCWALLCFDLLDSGAGSSGKARSWPQVCGILVDDCLELLSMSPFWCAFFRSGFQSACLACRKRSVKAKIFKDAEAVEQ